MAKAQHIFNGLEVQIAINRMTWHFNQFQRILSVSRNNIANSPGTLEFEIMAFVIDN